MMMMMMMIPITPPITRKYDFNNNEVVKKSTHKALKAKRCQLCKKLIGRESEQGAAAQIKHDGKIGINSGKKIHDHAVLLPAEAAVKAVHEKRKIKKDRREM